MVISLRFRKTFPASLSTRTTLRINFFPAANDGNGFGNGVEPPGGFILRERRRQEWELYAAGMRNTYDFDFGADGEMFGFDSDMEWDWGMPWYRPTRINHLVSGGEYGFREGTAQMARDIIPTAFPAIDIGIGSPTGVKFGTNSKFPEKYRKALYAWIGLTAEFSPSISNRTAPATGDFEVFLKGKPLNLTDIEFGKDGAMYFITGGRGTQSGLYRVSYIGGADT